MKKRKKKPIGVIITTTVLLVMVVCGLVYSHFGGFSTGKSADVDEFAKYAEKITGDELPGIDVPEGTRIVALGEATHGNREFQELKKLVFQDMVENNGIRAFVLEAAHYADVLIQNSKLSDEYENNPNGSFGLNDTFMAENAIWILAQEEQLGNKMIFICGHNGHMEQFGTYRGGNDKVMGNILADEVGSDAYFSLGTDFYKTTCNLPKNEKQRTTFTVYSHDSLAKAAYKSGNDICMLDFSKVPDDSSIAAQINGYAFMGSLGDQSIGGINRIVMRAIPYTYREWKNPHEAYDAMIFVSKAHPTKTRPKTGDTL